MFWKEKQNKFSIRKFNRGVASVIIGMTAALFFVPNLAIKAELTALAHTNVAREQISYKYVLYSELTSDEKARIQATIPARQVGDTHTYYMVYRPKTNLPQTGDIPTFTSSLVGLGLLIIGLSLTKDRKKRIVRSLIILTATGSLSVAAISTGSLSGFDKQFTLSIGEALPQAVISIDQHEFVGYILEGHVNSEAITVSEAIIDEQGSSSELILPNILVEGISKHSEAPIVDDIIPEEPTVPVAPSEPITEQPEASVPPSTEDEVQPEEPTDPVAPSEPVTDEPKVPETPVSPTVEDEVQPEEPKAPVVPSNPVTDEPEAPVPPSTEAEVLPEEPTAPVVPSSPVTDEPETPVPPSTEDEVQPAEPTDPVVPSSPVTEQPEAPVPPATEDEVLPEEPTDPVVPSAPVTEQPEEPETPVPPSTESEVLPEEPTAPVAPSAPVTDEPEEPIKTKPKLVLSILKENVDDKTVELSYTLTDSDSTFVKAMVSLYKGDELVTEKEILTQEELYKVQFANLLLNTEYKVKTRFAYNLGSDDVEEELRTEKFELENKLLELREYKSIELYQVDERGEKTRVTALTNAPISSENYLVKISTVNNKDIYLPVDNFENDVNGIKVSIIHPKLVKFNQNNSSFDEHYTFTVDKLVLQEGAYSKFSELVDAINNNPSGTYYLAADMVVDKEVSTDTYVTKEFTGSLKSLGGQKAYSILQLDRPLFSTLKNARVENISLKDVSIKNDQTAVAALAKKSDKSTIDKVSVSGNITAKQNIAGLVYEATNGTTISNSIVNVNLSNTASHEIYYMGGVTGILNSSTIDKVRVNVAIDAKTASGRGQKIGGVTAEMIVSTQQPIMTNVYVTGKIEASAPADTGGVVGLARMSVLNNIATGVSVTNGGIIASGQNAYATVGSTISNLYSVEGHATGQPNPTIQSTSLSQEAVLEKIKA
ncbi:zinc metalloprotease ZmpC [Streptococcus suis]|uniref:Zinc metalloprotease ZmpC n=1 Tax=Streptococcus suis TaxID=1307 RepID=A0A0Z8VCC0_STRSU|nr:ZmpA/ZmpB/ZmpC family metallo-endopeptidase-related protein [Streptococcus suis]CYX53328.1 zinc metalloprotease ZmpC [Streptococcus suis]